MKSFCVTLWLRNGKVEWWGHLRCHLVALVGSFDLLETVARKKKRRRQPVDWSCSWSWSCGWSWGCNRDS